MLSKPLILTEPLNADRDEFLAICKQTDCDPVTAAILTDTNVDVKKGPSGAANKRGSMRQARNEFRVRVKAQIENYQLPGAVTKEYVRSARLQVLNDALRLNDPKIALEATKQIATDQGIFGPTEVVIRTDALGDILAQTPEQIAELKSVVFLPDDEVKDETAGPDGTENNDN